MHKNIRFILLKLYPVASFGFIMFGVICKILHLSFMKEYSTLYRLIIGIGALYFVTIDILLPVVRLLKSNIYEER